MTDAGTYTAVGVNDVGTAETSCTVTITQPMEEPKFSSLLRSAKAVEGSPIKLEGKSTLGYPINVWVRLLVRGGGIGCAIAHTLFDDLLKVSV